MAISSLTFPTAALARSRRDQVIIMYLGNAAVTRVTNEPNTRVVGDLCVCVCIACSIQKWCDMITLLHFHGGLNTDKAY